MVTLYFLGEIDHQKALRGNSAHHKSGEFIFWASLGGPIQQGLKPPTIR
jgi:hypothetical protein